MKIKRVLAGVLLAIMSMALVVGMVEGGQAIGHQMLRPLIHQPCGGGGPTSLTPRPRSRPRRDGMSPRSGGSATATITRLDPSGRVVVRRASPKGGSTLPGAREGGECHPLPVNWFS
jgi:hypothetical protein